MKKREDRKKFLIIFFLFFIFLFIKNILAPPPGGGDPPNQIWNTTGPTGTAYGIAVDNNGGVFVTGESGSNYYTIKYNTMNGSQVWNITNGGKSIAIDNQADIYLLQSNLVIKHNSIGNQIWDASFDGSPHGIAVDNNGGVYSTGSKGITDVPLTDDYYTIKYNASNGSQIWNVSYDATGGVNDIAYAAASDNGGNIYVTGVVNSTILFQNTYYTIKYNSNGDGIWSASGPVGSTAYSIATDNQGFVYVTGILNNNYYTIKYNSTNGSQIWSATYDSGGVDIARGIAVDSSQNVYVTGEANGGYRTIKYNSSGSEQWQKGGVAGTAYGIAVDNQGFIYVAGESEGNYYTIKYNNVGGSDIPSVYLISPVNGATTSNSPVAFSANATDNVNVTNMTLYIWNSTNSLINKTTNSSCGSICITNISVELLYSDNYKWNYYACDDSSNCAWGSNFSLIYNDIPIIDVIVVESSDTRTVGSDTDWGITGKTVTFPLVIAGGAYATNITNASGPHPFLIRNIGNDNANVSIWADSYILNSPTSKIEFWAQPGKPQSGGSENWNNVDNCAASCYDTTKTAYTGDGGTNFCNNNPTACCATASYCLPISSIQGSGNQKVIIYKLSPNVLTNEALLNVKVSVGISEPSGAKSGTINIVGSYTT